MMLFVCFLMVLLKNSVEDSRAKSARSKKSGSTKMKFGRSVLRKCERVSLLWSVYMCCVI